MNIVESFAKQSNRPLNAAAFQFLRMLWPEGIAPYWLLIWTLTGDVKRSFWFRTIEEAATFAAETTASAVYFGLGLAEENLGPHRRCKADQIVALPGFGIDIDVAGPTHTKLGLPPTREEALKILPADFAPTLVTDTGWGFQAFWLFRERVELKNEDDRHQAAAISQRLHRWIEGRAEALGYTVDSVFDLSHVFRLVGTSNQKVPGEHKAVRIWE